MDLKELKEELHKIQIKISQLTEKCQKEIAFLKDDERTLITRYNQQNAKYHVGDKVIVNGAHRFIGWIDIDKEKWEIRYRTFRIKADGCPASTLSSNYYYEEQIEPLPK